MAFLNQLSSLTEELVEATTSVSTKSDRKQFRAHHELAFGHLRHHSFLRTNQFDVEERLRGIDERFRIQDRDALADALKQRLEAFAPLNLNWAPDVLHFLLELSDQPTQKSRLADLELLKRAKEESGPKLRWEDIAEEDGWANDKSLWRNVNFADSSDDDAHADAGSEASAASEDTSLSSLEAHHQRQPCDIVAAACCPSQLEGVRKSQAWRHEKDPLDRAKHAVKTAVSELQVVREVLFMLHGLQTTLFHGDCSPALGFQLEHVPWAAYKSIITTFGENGRRVQNLRRFVEQRHEVALLQVFQDSLTQQLRILDMKLDDIQSRFVKLERDVIVSLMAVLDELNPTLTPIFVLSGIIERIDLEQYAHSFRYLELLFDAASAAQLEGRGSTYRCIGRIFFDCFGVYLRPIRQWMEDGHLTPGDKTFFVSVSAVKVALPLIWQDQFKLRQTRDGTLHAPKFLQPALRKIFNTGKSIVLLKHLGRYEYAKARWKGREPVLDFDTICPPGLELAPFPELFNAAFERWILTKHHETSSTLHTILLDSCGLWSTLDALQFIYFMKDGAVADSFASAVFRSLDELNPYWYDRFALAEHAQEAFGSRVDAYRVSATVTPEAVKGTTAECRRSVRAGLPALRLKYRLSWPVQVILSAEALERYQQVFTLLLQLRRATYVLNQQRPRTSVDAHEGAPAEHDLYLRTRMRLRWFCHAVQTHLTTLVLARNAAGLRAGLAAAEDVDALIAVHDAFARRVADEACLGTRLAAIRDGLLDVLDLAVRLQDARTAREADEADETHELSRLSVMSPGPSSPPAPPLGRAAGSRRRGVYTREGDDEDDEDGGMARRRAQAAGMALDPRMSYAEVLLDIGAQFDRHLRFICGGLRGVARARSDAAATKWDMLAEMLELGIRDGRPG